MLRPSANWDSTNWLTFTSVFELVTAESVRAVCASAAAAAAAVVAAAADAEAPAAAAAAAVRSARSAGTAVLLVQAASRAARDAMFEAHAPVLDALKDVFEDQIAVALAEAADAAFSAVDAESAGS